MPELQAIAFDLDDTLYPEQAYVLSGFQAVSVWAETHLGIQAHEGYAELGQLFAEGVRGNVFDLWMERYQVDPDQWVSRMVRVYREHIPNIIPFPGVPELLQRLRSRYRIGLVSDGYAKVQRRKLDVLQLESYFDAIVFSDELEGQVWKPHCRPFEVFLSGVDIPASQAVYVADNPDKDFLGARRAGMRTVRFRSPEGLYRDLEPASSEYAPEAEIKTLDRLEMTLHSIGEQA